MTVIKLTEAPVTIDADAIAKGVIAMMRAAGEGEEDLIRLGMLPSRWIALLTRMMREKFESMYGSDTNPMRVGVCNGEIIEFNIDRLVSEAVQAVCLAMYSNVDMLV